MDWWLCRASLSGAPCLPGRRVLQHALFVSFDGDDRTRVYPTFSWSKKLWLKILFTDLLREKKYYRILQIRKILKRTAP